ncbi:MAG: major facilitator superfamily 1 [Firmicutes bacterium]|nr:major facilitator superfamily 1 [Bacillota bacterium]
MINENAAVDNRMPWRFLLALFFGQIANVMTIVVPMMLLLTFKFMEITPDSVKENFGMTAGFSTIAVIILSPVLASIADKTRNKFGRRRTWILAGGFLGGLMLIAVNFATKVWMVVVLWCLVQVLYSVVANSIFALVPEQIPEARRGIVSGAMGVFAPASVMLGMTIMMSMADAALLIKWAIVAGIGFVAAMLVCILVKEKPLVEKVEDNKNTSVFTQIIKFYPSPRKYPSFTWGFITRFLQFLATSNMTFSTIYLIEKFHMTESEVTAKMGVLAMAGNVCFAVASIGSGWLSDKLQKQKIFVIAAAVGVGVGPLVLVFASSFTEVLISNLISGIAGGVYLSVDMALITRILPNKEDFAKDASIMNIASSLPNSITGFVAPPLIAAGGFPLFYAIFSCFAFLSALAVLPIPEMKKRESLPMNEIKC